MRVLFVSGIDGPCHRYQVLHRAAQLRRFGAEVRVCSFRDPALAAAAPEHDLLFLYRVPATPAVGEAIARARAAGRHLIGAIDDLVFCREASALPRLDSLSPAEQALWRRGVERYRATLAACDAFLGPTEPLVDAALALGWDARLHRNSLAPAELALAEAAADGLLLRRRGEVVLGYFSGTPTHDDDFASIAPALALVLRRHPHVRLRVLGPLRLDPSLEPFAARVERRPAVAWSELPRAVAAVDLSLAPLAGGRFALAKGEVKYLEAAAVAVPTVASPTPAFCDAIGDGVRGRLAGDGPEWCAALDELVCDEALRRELGRRARSDALDRWTEERRAAELWREVERVVARPPASGRIAPEDAESEALAALALEPDACPALPPTEAGAATPPLGQGQRLAQVFRPTRNGLRRVDVHAITYGQALDHELRLTLRTSGGRVVAAERCAAAHLPDRGWFALDVPPQPGSAEESYDLELEATGTGPGNAASFGLAAAPSSASGGGADGGVRGACARFGDEPLAAPLALRAFAAWEHALAAPRRRDRVTA